MRVCHFTLLLLLLLLQLRGCILKVKGGSPPPHTALFLFSSLPLFGLHAPKTAVVQIISLRSIIKEVSNALPSDGVGMGGRRVA